MPLFFRYAWVLFIAVTCLKAAILWRRSEREVPESREGYRRLAGYLLVFGNLPWIVMGAGILVGGVPTIFHHFNPRNGPFVIAWYATIVLVWILAGGWLFVGQGAEFLARHPGLLNPRLTRPWMIRVVFVLSVLGGAMAMTAMVLGDFEVPTLP